MPKVEKTANALGLNGASHTACPRRSSKAGYFRAASHGWRACTARSIGPRVRV